MSRAHNCTSPSPPSSPATVWDSSPPSSPSPPESSLPPFERIIDPLAASYNVNHSKRNPPSLLFTPQPKRTRYTAPLPTTQIQPIVVKQRSQADDDLEYKIWEEASNKVFESGCRTIDLRYLTNYFSLHITRPFTLLKLNSTVIAS